MEAIKNQLLRGDIHDLACACKCSQVTVRAALSGPRTAKQYEVIAKAKELIEYRKSLLS